MRVAIVRQHYHSDGAVERVTERALDALLERNVAVSLYTRAWPQTRLQLVEPVVCNPAFLGANWRDWGFARAACRLIRQAKPSLVESHERLLCCDVYRAQAGVHAVWLEERLKRASLAERLAMACSPRNRYLLGIERRLFGSPWLRAVICPSAMVKDEIRGRYALPESKLRVIRSPVDSARFHPGLRSHRASMLDRHGIAAAATVFLTIAGERTRHGVDTVLDAFAQLEAPVHLIVVGDGQALVRQGARIRALGAGTRVTLVAHSADMRPYYGTADAFVESALYDPAPELAIEAMACGLPLVTTSKSGAAELATEHEAGLAYPSGDLAALVDRLRRLQDATTRAHFASNARRAVLPLSPSATTLQWVLLYRDLLAAAVPPSVARPTTLSRA